MNDTLVFDWLQAEVAGPKIVGGKGWNLGRMFRYGFHIPPGGVISSTAYSHFMADPLLTQLQEEIQNMSAEEATASHNVRLLGQMETSILDTPLSDQLVEQVREFLFRNKLENVPMAVRSSATAEDSAVASFAGIHASRLGQVGIDAIVDGIRACYASLWTPRAVAYRRHIGILDTDVLCAVVLCRMIGAGDDPSKEPQAAGVAFSCDPRVGRFDVVTIGAVRGLGDQVVDGTANPEEISVSVDPNPKIIERNGKGEPVLTDEQALQLAHLIQRVQWALGDGQEPQDVEWAYDGSSFWIVQARPVTRMPRHTFEGAKDLPVVWSNANLKDALPGVLSPLGWSMILTIVRHNLYAPHMAAGYPIPPGLESMRRFSGRAYFDLTSLFWAFYDALGMSPAEFNRSLGGHQPEFSVPETTSEKSSRTRYRNRLGLKLFREILRLDKNLPAEINTLINEVEQHRQTEWAQLSMEQLRQKLKNQIEVAYQFGPRSMLANTSAGLWHDLLENLLSKVASDEEIALASDLMAGSGNVVSAEHGYRLIDLAEAAKSDVHARAWLETEPWDGTSWKQLPETSMFRSEMEKFFADFGHRAVYEVDIANPRWIEDPTYILQQVRSLMDHKSSGNFREEGWKRRIEAERTVARRTIVMRPIIRWLAARARHGFAMREGAKSALVSLLEPCRRAILELGHRMHADQLLDEPNDIFYLSWIEIDAFMLSRWRGEGAKALVADRKAQREFWLAQEPPDVIIEGEDKEDRSEVVPMLRSQSQSNRSAATSLPDQSSSALIGTGVAAGIASGRVRILRHPSEGEKLLAGEILVAPSTDPGWTPLFMRASAIVMEAGGYHSHGATVAREFGIPAVANIPNLLSILQDGERISVDGNTGRILRQSEP